MNVFHTFCEVLDLYSMNVYVLMFMILTTVSCVCTASSLIPKWKLLGRLFTIER